MNIKISMPTGVISVVVFLILWLILAVAGVFAGAVGVHLLWSLGGWILGGF